MLFSESELVRKACDDVKQRTYDRVKITCGNGVMHEIYGRFDPREYVDQFDQARAKITENFLRVDCADIYDLGLDPRLRRCHVLVESEKTGRQWYRIKMRLKQGVSQFNLLLEECDEPKTNRKAPVDFNAGCSTNRFRTRRKVTGCPTRRNRTT